MDAQVVNSFINAARTVMKYYLTKEVNDGALSLKEKSYPSQDVNIILGVLGQVRGEIIYGMETSVALSTVSKMMGDAAKISKLDEMAFSAISELANMISGNAAALMGDIGVHCNITPPLVVTGKKVTVHTLEIKSLVIPLHTELGEITINVALEEA